MVQVKENGAYLELEDDENVFSSLVDVTIYKGKRIVTPNEQVSIAIIQSKDKYYVAKFDGKWSLQEINNLQPIGLTVRIPLTYESPLVVCQNRLFCSGIKKFVDNMDFVIYPTNVNLPTIVVTEAEKETIWYVFIPNYGWFEIKEN